jgi:hypothetical protein
MAFLQKTACAAAAMGLFLCALGITGCGTPAAPQPPSLNLPEPAKDLAAQREGDIVTLHWTMPKKTTDHVSLNYPIQARIWRSAVAGAEPSAAGTVSFPPGAPATYTESLPHELASGNIRPLTYSVELLGKHGRSAGRSELAQVPAGQSPPALGPLTAEVRADGVALFWKDPQPLLVILHRRLLTPPEKKPAGALDSSTEPAEPAEVDLRVNPRSLGQQVGALDPTARFGLSYEYTARAADRLSAANTNPSESRAIQMLGQPSPPIRVDVIDTFPPAIPQGLVTIWVEEEKTIDLSWQPDTEQDLAGYIVYRAEADGPWKRISGTAPLTSPAFRDSQATTGHTYRYAVTAIDLLGNESKRSPEATETVPRP